MLLSAYGCSFAPYLYWTERSVLKLTFFISFLPMLHGSSFDYQDNATNPIYYEITNNLTYGDNYLVNVTLTGTFPQEDQAQEYSCVWFLEEISS